MKIILAIAVLIQAVVATAGEICPPLNYDELMRNLKDKSETHLVFFASWCSGCKEHLVHATPKKSILIATFDEPASAEKVVNKLGLSSPCYLDRGISDRLNVKSLPYRLTWQNGKFSEDDSPASSHF